MDYSNFNKHVCRICLKNEGLLNWNDDIFEFCGMTYKKCYYKYTQLEKCDSDFYPTKLCGVCANDLKNAHLIFEKALESFKILQVALTAKELKSEYSNLEICNSQPIMTCQTNTINESKSIELIVDNNSPASDNMLYKKSLAETENAINNSKEMCMGESVTVEAGHFIDIRNFESPEDTLLVQNLIESCDTDLPKSTSSKITGNKRNKCENLSETSLEPTLEEICVTDSLKFSAFKKPSKKRKKLDSPVENLEENLSESCDNGLPKSLVCKTTSKKSKKLELTKTLELQLIENCVAKLPKALASKKSDKKRKKNESTTVTLLEENLGDSFDNKSPVPPNTKPAVNPREKYLLMCAYCSLKVEGAKKLKKHEATHSENRKRTEICPQCGLKLYTDYALKCHMKIHDANRQKNHKCEFCEKAFFNRGALNVHRRIHLGQMVKCQICSKEFFRQVDLNKHLLKHSVSPLQKNAEKIKYAVQCQYCNKSVLTTKWKEHKAAHLDQPQVKCKICDKNFFARSKCAKHLRQVHHRIRGEYEEFIHYYDVCNTRMSSLMMKQQEKVQPLTE